MTRNRIIISNNSNIIEQNNSNQTEFNQIINNDDENARKINHVNKITYGMRYDSDYVIADIKEYRDGFLVKVISKYNDDLLNLAKKKIEDVTNVVIYSKEKINEKIYLSEFSNIKEEAFYLVKKIASLIHLGNDIKNIKIYQKD